MSSETFVASSTWTFVAKVVFFQESFHPLRESYGIAVHHGRRICFRWSNGQRAEVSDEGMLLVGGRPTHSLRPRNLILVDGLAYDQDHDIPMACAWADVTGIVQREKRLKRLKERNASYEHQFDRQSRLTHQAEKKAKRLARHGKPATNAPEPIRWVQVGRKPNVNIRRAG